MSQQPVPVEPLNYYPPHAESWRPVVRACGLAAMAIGVFNLAVFVVLISFSFFDGGIRVAFQVGTVELLFFVSEGAASIAVLFSGFRCYQLKSNAQRVLIWFLTGMLILQGLLLAFQGYQAFVSGIYGPNVRLPQVAFYVVLNGVRSIEKCLMPLLLIWFLSRKPSAELLR